MQTKDLAYYTEVLSTYKPCNSLAIVEAVEIKKENDEYKESVSYNKTLYLYDPKLDEKIKVSRELGANRCFGPSEMDSCAIGDVVEYSKPTRRRSPSILRNLSGLQRAKAFKEAYNKTIADNTR